MKILSLFTDVVPNLYDLLSSMELKIRSFEYCSESQWETKLFGYQVKFG